MKKIEPILEKVGLTRQESRVYVALLELQEAKAGALCRFTKIASSNIYNILDSLMKKGIVSYRVENNIKVFIPSPPEVLNELFLEKQKNLDRERREIAELIHSLKKRKVKEEPYSNYKYYQGISGLKSMWYEINSIMSKENIIKIHTAKKGSYERLVGFYTEHHRSRQKKKVEEWLIYPKEDLELAKKRKREFKRTIIKFLDLKNDAEWGIVKDNFFMQYAISKKPHGFLIKDKIFAKTFEEVFDRLWNIATHKP